ncbi:MAG: hypothetical protein M1837_003864 [Sclerophora amabilis]|nr:MAG: hypothetical protein M1837_003864 [Sclerophora amabilis]
MASSSLPLRQPHSRNHSQSHSHTLSAGSMNQTHRVTRRKSTSSTTANNAAAMAAALKEASEAPLPASLHSTRKSLTGKMGAPSGKSSGTMFESEFSGVGDHPISPSSFPNHGSALGESDDLLGDRNNTSAVTDGPLLQSYHEHSATSTKARLRRASEGSALSKSDGKRVSGNELRCEKCGKGYKHSSCLTKHLWEHTPEWSYTSKLLISKHQQVQLLEAASVLVAMNQDEDTPPGSAKEFASDDSSASPSASGSSGLRDGMSSADTTPPPQAEDGFAAPLSIRNSRAGRAQRRSSNGSSFSRSHQSTRTNSVSAGSAPSTSSAFAHYRLSSGDRRPSSSGSVLIGEADEDEAGLAAAVELLSCGFGTPRTGPLPIPEDVPPVPPLPARYLGANSQTLSGGTVTPSFGQNASVPGQMDPKVMHDIDMDEGEESNVEGGGDDDSDHRSYSRGQSDEDDDGIIFGGMDDQ